MAARRRPRNNAASYLSALLRIGRSAGSEARTFRPDMWRDTSFGCRLAAAAASICHGTIRVRLWSDFMCGLIFTAIQSNIESLYC